MGTGDTPRDNNLGALRFAGAYLVVVGHSWLLSSGPSARDPLSVAVRDFSPFHQPVHGLGVMMFFVISGLLVTASFERSGSVLRYAFARALRIYPALIVAVAACALLLGPTMTTLPVGSYLRSSTLLEFIARNGSLLGGELQLRLPGVFQSNPLASVNGSLWTLPIELRMYGLVIVFGVLRLFRHRHAFNAIAILLVVAFVARSDAFPLLSDPRHDYLGLSFLLGSLAHVNRDRIVYRGWGLIALWSLTALASETAIRDLVATIAFAYSILWIGLHPRWRLPRLDRYGDFSYGIYLYAYPVQQLAVVWLGVDRPELVGALAFVGATLLGACSWYAVERPALDWKRSVLSRMRGTAAAVSR